jgi:hypothetical protein
VDYEFKAMHTVLAAATASDLLASSMPVSKFLDFHRLLVAFLDPQHVILAEHDNRLVGFVFSAPDINERAWGRAPKPGRRSGVLGGRRSRAVRYVAGAAS